MGECTDKPRHIGINGSFCGLWFEVLQDGGFEIDERIQSNDSFFACSRNCFTDDSLSARGYQMPQTPGYPTFCHKQVLASLVRRGCPECVPVTWSIPQGYARLEEYARQQKDAVEAGGQRGSKKQFYIFKPAAGARGEGIRIFDGVDKLRGMSGVVQPYLEDLIRFEGWKTDFRLYLLITSEDPLIVYLYDEGVARFAQAQYEEISEDNAENLQMHLTNTAMREGVTVHEKMLFSEALEYASSHAEAIFDVGVAERITTHSLRAGVEELLTNVFTHVYHDFLDRSFRAPRAYEYPKQFFGIYGADVAFRRDGTPVLLEINLQPALPLDDEADRIVKPRMLREALQLVGIRQENIPFDPENPKFASLYQQVLPGSNLTIMEKRVLMQIVDEAQRLGDWKRLEISQKIKKYGQWNRLLADWEEKLPIHDP